MKWFDAYKYKPKDMSSIWVWNTVRQKQELFIAKWINNQWDADQLPYTYARMWAYVFDEDKLIYDQPERLNPEDRCYKCNFPKESPCRNCLLDEITQ